MSLSSRVFTIFPVIESKDISVISTQRTFTVIATTV
jgi:hypothetical protein